MASIANIFQGFDSGIYSIIISDPRFIDYFNVAGARAGVVASMGESLTPANPRALNTYARPPLYQGGEPKFLTHCNSKPRKRSRQLVRVLVVHLVPRAPPCLRPRNRCAPRRRGSAGWRHGLCHDRGGSHYRRNWNGNVRYPSAFTPAPPHHLTILRPASAPTLPPTRPRSPPPSSAAASSPSCNSPTRLVCWLHTASGSARLRSQVRSRGAWLRRCRWCRG